MGLGIGGGEDQTWQEMRTLLSTRVADGLAGDVSTKNVDAIVDEEMGEESRI